MTDTTSTYHGQTDYNVPDCETPTVKTESPQEPAKPSKRDLDKDQTWKKLLYDYSQNTTFHGVRFITSSSRYSIRQIIWLCIFGITMTVFAYLFISRLVHYFGYPRTVNMELTYKSDLPFPAVTICNQNQFRLTKVQKAGLYDTLTERLGRSNSHSSGLFREKRETYSTGCKDSYMIPEPAYTCIKPDHQQNYSFTYNEVTLNGCKQLCTELHDMQCSTILFTPTRRSCYLLPRVNIAAIAGGKGCVFAEIYQRQRCLSARSGDIYCNFEEKDCPLRQDSTNREDWQRILAQYVSRYPSDHTTFTKMGHVSYLTERSRSVESTARLATKFFKSDNYCLQVFVRLLGRSVFRIHVKGEDFINHQYAEEGSESSLYFYRNPWNMIFIRLPNGINQIILEGHLPKDFITGILMDDLTIASCAQFDEATCRETKDGENYLGSLSVSASGKPCQPWTTDQKTQIKNKYIRETTLKECRKLTYTDLVCHIGNGTLEKCNIKPCDCRKGTRACENGICIPSNMFCDGMRDCTDGSDELKACDVQRKVDCNFKSEFRCGYSYGGQRFRISQWERKSPVFENLFNNDSYMVVDTSRAIAGGRVGLRSPSTSVEKYSCLTFDFIVNNTDAKKNGDLAVYMHKDMSGRRLWVSKKIGKQVAHVSVPANQSNFSFGFLATIADPSSNQIAITNVKLLDKNCKVKTPTGCDFRCDDGNCINKTALCDGVSDCEDETDELYETCSDSIISPSCDFNDKYMCGYKVESSFRQLTWKAQKKFDTPKSTTSMCVKNFTAPTGKITSPNYPEEYGNNADCRYMIKTAPGTQIKIEFESFTVEMSVQCLLDWLQIFDSDNVTPVTGKLCGSEIPKPVLSTNNSMVLIFKSDVSYSLAGFIAKYMTLGSAANKHLINGDGIVAAQYTEEDSVPYFNTLLTSPKVILNSARCLTFRYFNQARIRLWRKSGEDFMSVVHAVNLDGGKAWHSVSLNIPAGSYHLQWEADGTLKELPLVGRPEDVYLAAIDDVVIHNVTCEEIVGSNGSMACDFGQEDLCGYNISLRYGHWFRVRRKRAYYLATNTNFNRYGESITSPYATITNGSCIALTSVVIAQRYGWSRGSTKQLPKMLVHYDVYFYNKTNDLKHMANLYVEHATASYAVLSFSGVDLKENGEDLRMEIKIWTASFFYLDRVEVFSDCTGVDNASRILLKPDEFADSYDSDEVEPYKASNYPKVTPPTGRYIPGVIFSDKSTYPPDSDFDVNIYSSGSGTISPVSPAVQYPPPPPPSPIIGFPVATPTNDLTSVDYHLSFSTNYTTVEPPSQTDDTSLSIESVTPQTVAPSAGTQTPVPSVGSVLDSGQAYATRNTSYETYVKPEYGTEVIKDMDAFHTDSGPQLSDLIYRCNWDKEPCQRIGFKSHVTDLGYCHTFNADPEMNLKVSKTGSGFGLSLIVNIEQYEYIESDNTDAGIKVQLHDQDDVPMIKDLGFAVSPGVHALVASSYTTAKGLKDPYGTCDEAPLPFYGQGATYTHARCKQQCNSNYTMLNCSCKDAFMPGISPVCNITEYLDCILPIKEQSGFARANCTCPDACKVKIFGVELSYSSLSSLSVTSLLGDDVEHIVRAYRSALEIGHRVRVHQLQKTVEMLSNITVSLGRFVWVMESMGRYALQRANDAILNLKHSARSDFYMVSTRMRYFEKSYKKFQGKNVSLAVELFEKTVTEVRKAELQGSSAYIGMDSDRQLLQLLLDWVKDHTTLIAPFELKEYVPLYLWKPTGGNGCVKLMKTQTELFQNLMNEFNSANAGKFIQNSEKTKECFLDYETELEGVLKDVENAKESVSRFSRNEDKFEFEDIQLIMEEELAHIKRNMTYYDELARLYAENKITKLRLAGKINKDILKKMDKDIERLVHYLKAYAIGPLKYETEEITAHVPYWYHSILKGLLQLSQHFKNKGIIKLARDMQIWRVPVARFETTRVMGYKYEYGQQWKTWPATYSLERLLRDGLDLDVISSGIHDYIKTVNELLYELEDSLMTAKQQVLDSMTLAADSLEEFKKTAQISPEFVLNNFLMMDVYFPTLKYEAWEQIEAYGVENFLSETGGYMGLLIGGSVLTLLEILDLIIYNLVLRCMANRHSKIAVGSSRMPSNRNK